MADNDKTVVVYIATYANLDDANADYEAVKQLHSAGIIGTYDAAVVSKNAAGEVKITKTEKPTQYGAWAGLAVGVSSRLVLPALPGVGVRDWRKRRSRNWRGRRSPIGHYWRGLSRSDMKTIGDALQESTATLIVIGESKLEQALESATKHALKQFEKELNTDAKTFEKDLAAAVKGAQEDES